ncbi:hypothetical protein [Sphingomonas bacterium]|uniref:hypothetical protein n=1 Tax=Sphingomonas bacterium TaxID=1895847 RepID=UPI0015753DFF|nr:hypothetical protein [Sphingomonas bacterium]
MSQATAVSGGEQVVSAAQAMHAGTGLDQNVIIVGKALSVIRRERNYYLDDHISGDGAFSIVLAMFLDTVEGRTTSIDRVVEAADVPLSTAIYILGVLIESLDVERCGSAGNERYMLTVKAEQAIRNYLAGNVEMFRRAAQVLC